MRQTSSLVCLKIYRSLRNTELFSTHMDYIDKNPASKETLVYIELVIIADSAILPLQNNFSTAVSSCPYKTNR